MIGLILVMLLVACAFNDFAWLRIPNILTGALAILFVLWATSQGLAFDKVIGHVGVGVAVFIGGAVLFRFSLIGGGDVKLLAVTSLWLGPDMIVAHLILTSLFALALLLVQCVGRWFYPAVMASVQWRNMAYLPPVLRNGAGVPYGVAIAGSTLLLIVPKVL